MPVTVIIVRQHLDLLLGHSKFMRSFMSFSFLWISYTYNRPGLHSFWVISTHLSGTSETTTSRLTMTAAARVKMKLDMVFFLAVTKRQISHRKREPLE